MSFEESAFQLVRNIYNLAGRLYNRGLRNSDPQFLVCGSEDSNHLSVRCANCKKFVSEGSTCCGNYLPHDAIEKSLSYDWRFDFENLNLEEVRDLRQKLKA